MTACYGCCGVCRTPQSTSSVGQPANASALLSRQCSIRARLATFWHIRQDGADVAWRWLGGAGLLWSASGSAASGVFGAQGEQVVVESSAPLRRPGGLGNLATPHQSSPRRWAARTWLKMVESFSQSPRTSIHGLPRGALSSRLESSRRVWGEISWRRTGRPQLCQGAQQVACV